MRSRYPRLAALGLVLGLSTGAYWGFAQDGPGPEPPRPGAAPAGNAFSVQYRSGNALGGTGPGSAGEVLTSNGAGAAPAFQPASGGVQQTSGSFEADFSPECSNTFTPTFNYVLTGSVVTVYANAAGCTSDTNTFLSDPAALPEELRPTTSKWSSLILGVDNTATIQPMRMGFHPDGAVEFENFTGTFTSSGTKAYGSFTLTYVVD